MNECNELLGGWEGSELAAAERVEADKNRPKAVIRLVLRLRPAVGRRCSGYGSKVMHGRDVEEDRVCDSPTLDAESWLASPEIRLACPDGGPKLERSRWLGCYTRVTRRLEQNVLRLCQVLPIRHVAQCLGLDWRTVKRIDKGHLREKLGPPDFSSVDVNAMDGFAKQRGGGTPW